MPRRFLNRSVGLGQRFVQIRPVRRLPGGRKRLRSDRQPLMQRIPERRFQQRRHRLATRRQLTSARPSRPCTSRVSMLRRSIPQHGDRWLSRRTIFFDPFRLIQQHGHSTTTPAAAIPTTRNRGDTRCAARQQSTERGGAQTTATDSAIDQGAHKNVSDCTRVMGRPPRSGLAWAGTAPPRAPAPSASPRERPARSPASAAAKLPAESSTRTKFRPRNSSCDPLVIQTCCRVIFGHGPVDGQQPVVVAIDAAMIGSPRSTSPDRLRQGASRPPGFRRPGRRHPTAAPCESTAAPAESKRCTKAYITTPLVASEESIGDGVVAQK